MGINALIFFSLVEKLIPIKLIYKIFTPEHPSSGSLQVSTPKLELKINSKILDASTVALSFFAL